MIGITNVGGGGGMAYAYIGVIYTPGETVTCTDGNRTYRAKDTSGLYVFPVPYAATWVVTSTDGVSTQSKSVEITTLWQDIVIDLAFDGTLFKDGNQYEWVTGGWAYNQNLNSSGYYARNDARIDSRISIYGSSSSGCCYVQTLNTINLAGATSLTLNIVGTSSSSGQQNIILCHNNSGSINNSGNIVLSVTKTGRQTIPLSFSGETDYEFYATVGVYSDHNIILSEFKINYAS